MSLDYCTHHYDNVTADHSLDILRVCVGPPFPLPYLSLSVRGNALREKVEVRKIWQPIEREAWLKGMYYFRGMTTAFFCVFTIYAVSVRTIHG
jgi:GMP synthase PP-ATPase subunit